MIAATTTTHAITIPAIAPPDKPSLSFPLLSLTVFVATKVYVFLSSSSKTQYKLFSLFEKPSPPLKSFFISSHAVLDALSMFSFILKLATVKFSSSESEGTCSPSFNGSIFMPRGFPGGFVPIN